MLLADQDAPSVCASGKDGMKRLTMAAAGLILSLGVRAEWTGAEFVSVAKRLNGESEERTSAFLKSVVNEKDVVSATWRTTALGVYEAYVNGRETEGFLKPGFTHVYKRRLETKADVTHLWRREAGATNVLSALVTLGWWRDEITGRRGRDAGFRGILDLTYADGSKRQVVTDGTWLAGYAGPVVDASIFGGETYDARISCAWMTTGEPPEGFRPTNVCRDYTGDVTPMKGKAVHLREDLALKPVRAWVWKGVSGESAKAFGRIVIVREYAGDVPMSLAKGETLVVDFGQNAAAEPRFTARAARGTEVTLKPAEMLNDGGGLKSRGNDGPEGSVYRANLRGAAARAVYTFAGGAAETYLPRFSYFGFRYLSVTATDDVAFERLDSVPVSSIAPGAECGTLETGVPALNRFVENVKWGHYSNYLSVPTDCPQRNERLGWAADTQVFAPAALYLADVAAFLDGWMDDLVDSQHANGAYPSVAPLAQYGNEGRKIGWADAGVVVPWTVWKRTGDLGIVRSHWDSMMRFMRLVDESKYVTTPGDYQYADWLSFEPLETCRDGYWTCTNETVLAWWNYLGACYWRMDALEMAEMALALGDETAAAWCAASAERAMARLRSLLVDGRLPEPIRTFQSANLFALKLGVFADPARAADAKTTLLESFRANGNRLKTGFLSAAILMDTLVELGEKDLAYTLLLQHEFPSWLYPVDQGATTVWERWNSYTKKDGFGPVGMNSFNHYAYGAVLGWMYSTMAGIRGRPDGAGLDRLLLAPVPDRRVGFVKASYRTPQGVIRSEWKYEANGDWVWTYEIPEGTTAHVRLPDGRESDEGAGRHSAVCRGL